MAKKRSAAEAEPAREPGEEAKPESTASAVKSGLNFIVMLAGAVIAALVIKAYVFDVYLIPSGSMETALHGRPDGGDRILCPKFTFRFRGPKRWEVAVFEFPYESARSNDPYNVSPQYKGQNFVKRLVGMPGESLAISRGDIWTRPAGGGAFVRQVKPDSIQRDMWLNVYAEDFGDISLPELERFWKVAGGRAELGKGGPLLLSPGQESVRMEYRPLVPAGPEKDRMVELPGVPDRYTMEQPVQFRCEGKRDDGAVCGHLFVKTIRTQNMQARCPDCGLLLDETAAVFYHRRSGLPGVGRYGVDPRFALQGEEVGPRQTEYHFVPDLRLVVDAALMEDKSALTLVVREDSRFVQAVVHGDGRVELQVNGEPSTPAQRHVGPIRPGRRQTIEFYVVDGTARLFVDGAKEPVLDMPVWDDKRATPRALPRSSGAGLAAAGGEVRLFDVKIDRDVFYYSGWEHERGEKFAQMNSRGEVFIDERSFFPMGDHCPSSYDARSWGPVSLSLLRGPALLRWWPPERMGLIASP